MDIYDRVNAAYHAVHDSKQSVRRQAVGAAGWLSCSAHEHVWNDRETLAMAHHVLWSEGTISRLVGIIKRLRKSPKRGRNLTTGKGSAR
jgi:hypothetical protein